MSDNHMKHENGPMEGEYFYPEFKSRLKMSDGYCG